MHASLSWDLHDEVPGVFIVELRFGQSPIRLSFDKRRRVCGNKRLHDEPRRSIRHSQIYLSTRDDNPTCFSSRQALGKRREGSCTPCVFRFWMLASPWISPSPYVTGVPGAHLARSVSAELELQNY